MTRLTETRSVAVPIGDERGVGGERAPALGVPEALPDWIRGAPWDAADPLAVARELRPVLEAEAAESERLGRLTERSARALVESGLFGLLVPRELGGIEADAATYIDVIEELSYADGSAGWTVMATTFGIAGASMSLGGPAVDELFGGEGFICAGQVAPTGKAVRTDGGYWVSGRFQFGSGAPLASWLFGGFVVEEPDPSSSTGCSPLIVALVPRRRVRLDTGSWDVAGLSATASHDYEIPAQFVSDDFIMMSPDREWRGGPVFEIGVSIGHASWALGVALRAMDELKVLASHKRREGRATIIDQPHFQRDFGEMTGALAASRALVRSAFRSWHEAAKLGPVALEVHAHARNAACWATKTTVDVARFAYLASGSNGLRNRDDNRMQRCFRDLHAGATHKHVDDNVLIETATVFLGVHQPDLNLSGW